MDIPRISPEDLFLDIIEFHKLPDTQRNKHDLRFGQWFCNKYRILGDNRLFYTENFLECVTIIETLYVDHGSEEDVQ